jgi:SAM-dependent methyltransferase
MDGLAPLSRPDLFFESIPVDPLGHLYRRILDEQHPPGLQPTANGGPSRAVPARPLALRAEALTSLFAHNSFDMVASRNAIDHSQDPLRCLSEMVATVKPGRFVVLELFEREGAIQNYRDLHKWNFMWTQARAGVGSSSEGKERDSRACSRYCARRLRRSTAAGGIVRRLALGQHPRCTKGAFTKKRAGNARYRVF